MKPIRLKRWPLFVNHSVYTAPISHIFFFWSATRYPTSDPYLGQIWWTSLSRNQNEVHLDVSWIINSPNETIDSALQTHPSSLSSNLSLYPETGITNCWVLHIEVILGFYLSIITFLIWSMIKFFNFHFHYMEIHENWELKEKSIKCVYNFMTLYMVTWY